MLGLLRVDITLLLYLASLLYNPQALFEQNLTTEGAVVSIIQLQYPSTSITLLSILYIASLADGILFAPLQRLLVCAKLDRCGLCQKLLRNSTVLEFISLIIFSGRLETGYARVAAAIYAFGVAFTSPYQCVAAYFLSFVCDELDGRFARMLNQTSTLGAVLDMVTDRQVRAIRA